MDIKPADPLLEVRNLTKAFNKGGSYQERAPVVDHVSFALPRDNPETLTVAGESGSGKTTLALMILGFLKPTSGQILFKGSDIQKLRGAGFSQYRRQVQAVFQNPYEAFNPFYKIDHALMVAIHRFGLAKSKTEAQQIVEKALETVRLDPHDVLGKYPHQFSGGQLQRIMLARAFLLKPQIIIADEAVSMIDASLRAIILDIMQNLKTEFGISQVYITHDLSTALQISDRIIILYRGSVVESGSAERVIQQPKHPYTQLLIHSIPLPDPDSKWQSDLRANLNSNEAPFNQVGCKFFSRCPFRMDICLQEHPPLYQVGINQNAACYLYKNHGVNQIASENREASTKG